MTTRANTYLEKLWSNPEEMERFKASPKRYLNDHGASIPDEMQVHVHVDTPASLSFVLPADRSELPNGDNPVLNVIRQALEDPSYQRQLSENPKAALAEKGVTLPDRVEVSVYKNTITDLHAVIPMNPAEGELAESELESVAGGGLGLLKKVCDSVVTPGLDGACKLASVPATDVANQVSAVVGSGGVYGFLSANM